MHRTLLAILASALAGADAAPAPKEAATVMSPYEVRANSVSFDAWIKVGSPNFIVYTDASAKEASRVLREFEMLHAAGQALIGRKAARFSRTLLILPTASSDWRKLESKNSGIEWKSAGAMAGGVVVPVLVGQYDWQDEGLGIMRAVYSTEDMHRMGVAGPFWFEHGFGMYYETAEFHGDRVNLGHANPRIFQLKQAPWIPWGRFFKVNPRSPEFTKESGVQVYEAQTAVFTQYIFSHPDRAWVGRLEAWLDLLRSGAEPTEARFAAIFGQDWKKWQNTMETYLEGGRYSVFQIGVPPEVYHYAETKYPLPVTEIRELFILTQTLLQRIPESQVSLNALVAKGLRSDCLREVLIEACLDWGRPDAALENVRQLIAAGSTNAHVYREGDALLTRHAGSFGLDSRFGSELPEVLAWDRRGLELEPLDTDLMNSLSVNEAGAPIVDQQGIVTIEECYRRMKGRAPTDEVISALAVALWRIGDTKTAGELAEKLRDDSLVRKKWRVMANELIERIGKEAATASPKP